MKRLLGLIGVVWLVQSPVQAEEFVLIGEGGDKGIEITRAYHISEDISLQDVTAHMQSLVPVAEELSEEPAFGIIFDVVYLRNSCATENCLTGLNAANSSGQVVDFLSDYLPQSPAAFNGLYRTNKPVDILDCSKDQYYWCIR